MDIKSSIINKVENKKVRYYADVIFLFNKKTKELEHEIVFTTDKDNKYFTLPKGHKWLRLNLLSDPDTHRQYIEVEE